MIWAQHNWQAQLANMVRQPTRPVDVGKECALVSGYPRRPRAYVVSAELGGWISTYIVKY